MNLAPSQTAARVRLWRIAGSGLGFSRYRASLWTANGRWLRRAVGSSLSSSSTAFTSTITHPNGVDRPDNATPAIPPRNDDTPRPDPFLDIHNETWGEIDAYEETRELVVKHKDTKKSQFVMEAIHSLSDRENAALDWTHEYRAPEMLLPSPVPHVRALQKPGDKEWAFRLSELSAGEWSSPFPADSPVSQFARCQTVDEGRQLWETQPSSWAEDVWASAMLSLLSSDLNQACLFLQASFRHSKPSLGRVSGVVHHICGRLRQLPADDRRVVGASLCDAIVSILGENGGSGGDAGAGVEGQRPREMSGLVIGGIDLRWLITGQDADRLVKLYSALSLAGVHLTTISRMQFASRLSLHGAYKRLALRVMETGLAQMDQGPVELREGQWRTWARVLTNILQPAASDAASGKAEDAIRPDEIWDFSIRTGFAINSIHVTNLLRSLFKQGPDHAGKAWEIFDRFVQHGITVDRPMAAVLLQGSKESGSIAHITRALSVVVDHASNLNAPLKNNILHAILTLSFCRAVDPVTGRPKGMFPSSYFTMIQVYGKMFDMEPLRDLIPQWLERFLRQRDGIKRLAALPGFTSSLEDLLAMETGARQPPTASTLRIMILSFILSLHYLRRGPALLSFYGNFREMLGARHPVATALVLGNQSNVHDSLMKGLSTSAPNLRAALEIMSDMLHDATQVDAHRSSDVHGGASPGSAEMVGSTELVKPAGTASALPTAEHETKSVVTGPNPADALGDEPPSDAADSPGVGVGVAIEDLWEPIHPRPSKWSWNILLDAWLRLHKQDAAGHIISLMKQHGVEPSLVTWNTIMVRAAVKENTPLVVKAAKKIREAGLDPDKTTLRAFALLRNKEEFLRLMRSEEEHDIEDMMHELSSEIPPAPDYESETDSLGAEMMAEMMTEMTTETGPFESSDMGEQAGDGSSAAENNRHGRT